MKYLIEKKNLHIFALTTILILSLVHIFPFLDESITGDYEYYVSIVENVREGNFSYTYMVVPAIAALIPLDALLSLKIVGVISVLGLALISFKLVDELSGRWWGVASAGLVAFNPLVTRQSIRAMLDVPAVFFFTLAIYLYMRLCRDGSWKNGSLFLFASILAIFSKNTGILIVGVLAVLLALNMILNKRLNYSSIISIFAVFIIGIILYHEPLVRAAKSYLNPAARFGILNYFQAFNIIKIMIAVSIFFLLVYLFLVSVKSGTEEYIIPVWAVSYIIGLFLIHASTIVGRHILPATIPAVLGIVLSARYIKERLKISEYFVISGFLILILISFIFSIQHMIKFTSF